jgi:hypothetical protein
MGYFSCEGRCVSCGMRRRQEFCALEFTLIFSRDDTCWDFTSISIADSLWWDRYLPTLYEFFARELKDDDRNLKKSVWLCEQMDLKWSLEVGKLESCWRIEYHLDSYW